MNEFDLIQKYFLDCTPPTSDVILSIGDDAAVLNFPYDQHLLVATDTIVENVDFTSAWDPFDIAYKALAVNLSDFAAMGAFPRWFMLTLILPEANPAWLEKFTQGLATLAKTYQVSLVGGDLSRGSEIVVSIALQGYAPKHKWLNRHSAKVGDQIYVTGVLGRSALALKIFNQEIHLSPKESPAILSALYRPTPRLKEGQILVGFAHSAIDISDGLLADLGHILTASHVGANLYLEDIPVCATLKKHYDHFEALTLALTHGEDFELCFTANDNEIIKLRKKFSCSITRVGEITAGSQLNCLWQGKKYEFSTHGYCHF